MFGLLESSSKIDVPVAPSTFCFEHNARSSEVKENLRKSHLRSVTKARLFHPSSDSAPTFATECLRTGEAGALMCIDRCQLPLLSLQVDIEHLTPMLLLSMRVKELYELDASAEKTFTSEQTDDPDLNFSFLASLTFGQSNPEVLLVERTPDGEPCCAAGVDEFGNLCLFLCEQTVGEKEELPRDSIELMLRYIIIALGRQIFYLDGRRGRIDEVRALVFASDSPVITSLVGIGFQELNSIDILTFRPAISAQLSIPPSIIDKSGDLLKTEIDVFLLSGQSNMAGRGELKQLKQLTKIRPSENIFDFVNEYGELKEPYLSNINYYDPATGWEVGFNVKYFKNSVFFEISFLDALSLL